MSGGEVLGEPKGASELSIGFKRTTSGRPPTHSGGKSPSLLFQPRHLDCVGAALNQQAHRACVKIDRRERPVVVRQHARQIASAG